MRYIVTRPCLQEGSLSILKYLQTTFPQNGPAIFVDEKGDEHSVQVDTERRRVWGLGGLYHAQHLGVNDVLIITTLAPARYQVEAIVKPYAPLPSPRRDPNRPPETRRVVVSSTAHVREVRMQVIPLPTDDHAEQQVEAAGNSTPENAGSDTKVIGLRINSPEAMARSHSDKPGQDKSNPVNPGQVNSSQVNPGTEQAKADLAAPASHPAADHSATEASPAQPVLLSSAETHLADEAHLTELARLTGYRLDNLGGGVLRLNVELGAHGYAVLIALDEQARTAAAWNEETGYRVLMCSEDQHPQGVSRLTREAVAALTENARLAPLSPVDLRGYWKAGHVDLESAASVAELVSAHLAQRGIFSFVLLSLAQQPAHSVISVPRLADRLGSGVNYAELGNVLETLTRAPFLALTPLPGGQYLMRVGVTDLLTDLAEYADGIRRRVRAPASAVGNVVDPASAEPVRVETIRTNAVPREGIRA
ncbi:hypothetical protein ORD21_03195 [Deinococcus sp. ZS9-10]|uniref:DUF4388 domain-containing protein n=2 Tax=Deinococcus arenicola TaxID=2994950 RepID=A0ABU4DME1_9DEIO|nr:hypothetical protein [Deinococcus sp. ZS9-10]